MLYNVCKILAHQCTYVNFKRGTINVYGGGMAMKFTIRGAWPKKAGDHDNITPSTVSCIWLLSVYLVQDLL